MREEVENLIREGIGTVAPSPALLARAEGARRRSRSRRLAALSSAATVAAVACVFAFLPQRSQADEALRRTFQAWSQTAGIYYRLDTRVDDRAAHLSREQWFASDRDLSRTAREPQVWWDVTPSEVRLVVPSLRIIQVSRADATGTFEKSRSDAYGFLKSRLVDDLGPGGKRKLIRHEKNLNVDRSPAFALTFESAASPHVEGTTTYRMVVDERTNLPTSLTSHYHGRVIGGRMARFEDRYTFAYHRPMPDVYGSVAKGFETIEMERASARLLSLPEEQTPFGRIKWAGRGPQRSLLVVQEGAPPSRVVWKGTTWVFTRTRHKIDGSFSYSQPPDTSGWGMAVFTPLSVSDRVFKDLPFAVEASPKPYPRPVLEAMAAAYLAFVVDYASASVRYEEIRKLGDLALARADLEQTIREGLPGDIGLDFFRSKLRELGSSSR